MMISVTASLPSAAGQFGEQRLAEFGTALAAILGEEEHQAPKRIDVGPLDDVAPALFRLNEPRPGEHCKVRGKAALHQSRMFDELSRRKSRGFMLDEQPEGIEPRRVRQSREGEQSSVLVHTSGISDGYGPVNVDRNFPMFIRQRRLTEQTELRNQPLFRPFDRRSFGMGFGQDRRFGRRTKRLRFARGGGAFGEILVGPFDGLAAGAFGLPDWRRCGENGF